MNFLNLIELVCTLCTIGLFLTGTQVCKKIIKNKSVGDIPSLPFVSTTTNCCLWFFYGQIVGNKQIMLVNLVGALLQVSYSFVYLNYSLNKKKLIHQLIFIGLFLLSIYFYAFHYELNGKKAAFNIGLLANLVTVIMFGSPLASLKHVIRTQSTESISFSLCLFNFIVGIEWFVYGMLINDLFVQIPNLFGAILGCVQLSLFYKYPFQSLATKSNIKSRENQLINNL